MPIPHRFDPRWAAAVAERDGVFTRAEAHAFGVSDSLIGHRVRNGQWSLPAPRVLLTAPGPPTARQWERIALTQAGPGAALDDTTALRRHALRYLPPDDRIRLVIPAGVRRRVAGPVVVRRTALPIRTDPACRLPVLALSDAVVATCRRQHSLRTIRALVCEVVQRELVTPAQLLAAFASAPRPGSALLARAMDDVVAGCRSAPEAEARDLFAAAPDIPEPLWNARLGLAGGPFLACVDAYWRDAGVVHEVDSWAYHAIGAAWEATQRRRSRLAALGLIVLSNSPRRLREEGAAVCAEVAAALRLGWARGPLPGIVLLG